MKESMILVSFVLWFSGIVASIFLADARDRSVGSWLFMAAVLPVLSIAVLVTQAATARNHLLAAVIPAITPLLLAALPRLSSIPVSTTTSRASAPGRAATTDSRA